MKGIFEHLFVLGRPAGGKSEFIAFMKRLPHEERAREFGIGRFEEVDDFPWLFRACQEDDERETRGEVRLVSERTPEGYNITRPKFRGSLVDRFNEVIARRYLANPSFYEDGTLLIEFARGRDDGFGESLGRFRPDILARAAILYIQVSFEESFRRNSARYKQGEEESILFHKVPDRDMLGFFRENDWETLTGGEPHGYLHVGEAGASPPHSETGVTLRHAEAELSLPHLVRVPFVSMNNEPESTAPAVLRARYRAALQQLLRLYQAPDTERS